MKTNNNLARPFALATGILWVLCSAFVALFPDFSNTVTQWWMHGMNLQKYNISWESFIWGGLTLVASFWLVGYVLSWSIESFDKQSKK